jgi:hypothetical protein
VLPELRRTAATAVILVLATGVERARKAVARRFVVAVTSVVLLQCRL